MPEDESARSILHDQIALQSGSQPAPVRRRQAAEFGLASITAMNIGSLEGCCIKGFLKV